ncbi:disrupted in schizophrenia 1 protein [Callorhinchus milii]|uniref:disrupted in schizophrenia 1 protein n=1 Tax=Callorhinchus milii TaxID=7868 RepID=UPI001C3F56C1|nr:disrupted in schizophrenia 1 protein [Callorhinchus milii]
MFAEMDLLLDKVPSPTATATASGPGTSADSWPGRATRTDGCGSLITGVHCRKKKLSKRPGYMKKDVQEQLSHQPVVGFHLTPQQVKNNRNTCGDFSSDIIKPEGHCLNNPKCLRKNKITEHQNTSSKHISARNTTFGTNIIPLQNNRYSAANCQWTDCGGGSCYTEINTVTEQLSEGCRQKQDVWPTLYKNENTMNITKPQSMPDLNKPLYSEKIQIAQPQDTDEEKAKLADIFNSSFSFIQLSLNSSNTNSDCVNELQQDRCASGSLLQKQEPLQNQGYKVSTSATEQFCTRRLWEDVETSCWHSCQNVNKFVKATQSKDGPQDYDLLSLDTDAPLLFLADSSDGSSAGSSVTSGYGSSITAVDQRCNSLMRKYEPIIQDCLLENRTQIKLQSLILKLQKLQKKAVQEDDYEKADSFNKKLAELKQEKSSLKFQLPSYQPCIARFLEKVQLQAQVPVNETSTIFSNNAGNFHLKSFENEASDTSPVNLQISWSRRTQLIQEKQKLRKEIADLKGQLVVLETKDHQLNLAMEEEKRLIQSQDSELCFLSTVSANELQELNKSLNDILALRNQIVFSAELPEHIKRLQKKEQSLSIAIKATTAKAFSSQKLCNNLRKKVSDIETQLPILFEAKMLAVSGHEFSTAKDLSEEIKSLTTDKGRLEELRCDLQALSTWNAQRLEVVREDYSRLKTELQQEEEQFEKRLKENVFKYMEVLEDKINGCGSQLLERMFEADLEACQLFVRGLQLKEASYFASEGDEYRADEEDEAIEDPCSEIKDKMESVFSQEHDLCAVRQQKETASAENSRKCSLSIQNTSTKVVCEGLAVDIGEQCEAISDQLLSLEDQLLTATDNHDDCLTQSLQREIQMVKETLHAMLKQLLPLEEEEEESEDFVVGSR